MNNHRFLVTFLFILSFIIGFVSSSTESKAVSIIKYSQPTKEAVLPTDLREKYDKAIADGKSLLGLPYLMGGANRNKALDCSHFVYEVYKTAGINYGGYQTSGGLYAMSVKITDPAPGDLVFFSAGGTSITHVSIYLGNGMLLHESGKKANISPIKGWSWEKIFVGFGRLKQLHGDYKSVDATSDYSKSTSGGASDSNAKADGGSSETSSSKSEKSSSTSTSTSDYDPFDPFIKQKVAENTNMGIDKANLMIPTEVSYAITYFTGTVVGVFRFIMVLISLALIVLVALQTMIYVFISKNGEPSEKIERMEKFLFGESLDFNKYLKKILMNIGIVVIMLGFTLSGFYIGTISNFYLGIVKFIELFS